MRKVMVLEDESSIRSFIVINLRRAGYEVVEAETGEEALDKLHENPDTLVALLGVMLPGMASGWLCDQVGYHRFFLWALMATIPIFLIAWRIPFAHPDTEEGAAQAVEKELTDE